MLEDPSSKKTPAFGRRFSFAFLLFSGLAYTRGMKYLGIDFGTKKVGLAVSDEAGSIAFPRDILSRDERLLSHLKHVVAEEGIGAVVVGDTRAYSGARNQASDAADEFIRTLESELDIPVRRGIEAYSSVEASRYAPPGHRRDDSSAAAIILQRFLDMNAAR